jgi:hypothetical protein
MSGSGFFTPETIPAGWFDENLEAEGWFSQNFIEAVSSGGVTNANLTGASTLTFTVSASLRGGAVCSGASSLTFTSSGSLRGTARSSGASFLTFTVSGTLAGSGGDVEQPFFGGGYSNVFKRKPKRQVIEEDDEQPEAVEIVKIGDAPKRQIITGIVAPIRKARAKEAETLKRISRQQAQSERARAERIRRIIQADDEWLMTA